MDSLMGLLEKAFSDADIAPSDLPRLDLYMDQILTLVDEGLAANKRRPEDKLLTKTMVNNYSKERLILPVKGKKYSREQVIQLLCVLNLKQTLALCDLKALLPREGGEVDYEAAYEKSLALKARLRETLPRLLHDSLGIEPENPETRLALALALSSGATFLRRACEALVDGTDT